MINDMKRNYSELIRNKKFVITICKHIFTNKEFFILNRQQLGLSHIFIFYTHFTAKCHWTDKVI